MCRGCSCALGCCLWALPLQALELQHFNAYCALGLCAFMSATLWRLTHLSSKWYALPQSALEYFAPGYIQEHYEHSKEGKPIYHCMNQPSEPWFMCLLPFLYVPLLIGLLALQGGDKYWQMAFIPK